MISRFENVSEIDAKPAPRGAEPSWPAFALALLLLVLALLVSPYSIDKVVALHRWRATAHLIAYGLQVSIGMMIMLTLVRRKRLNLQFRAVFPTNRQFAASISVVILSLVFAVMLAEGLARALQLPFKPKWAPSENPLAKFDPELGWSYVPSKSVTQQFGANHREIPMYFDDLGCRVPSPGYHPDRSAPTALFVGDSFTFGHGVTYEESFAGRLANRPDFPFQVVNLGVQAYGTDQSLLLLKRQFKKFNTKLVVFTFTSPQIGRNEVYDRRLQFPDGLFLGTKPMFALNSNDSLYLARHPVELRAYSYSHLWAALKIVQLRFGPPPGVRLTRAIINDMKSFVESNGARFVVVDWYADEAFPWGLDVNVVYPSANPPREWDAWTIPGDGHPDASAHLYVSDLIAKKVQNDLATTTGTPNSAPQQRKW
ncbi:MAG TPA: SGNH/GDSL hydrolase family protein [Candidatus Acidoferrum sp.]|nr:SGNH/GDSL hydrolase family protein [Candidatus Acidoferrum sp.]